MKTIIERGASWTLEETKMLLALWGQDFVQRQASNTKRTKETYEKISEKFNQNGFERTAEQVRTRVFNMIAEYRRILRDPTSERMRKCIFFEALHKIYQAKHMDDVKSALDDYEPDYPYSPVSNTISSEKGDESISDNEANNDGGNETINNNVINNNNNNNNGSNASGSNNNSIIINDNNNADGNSTSNNNNNIEKDSTQTTNSHQAGPNAKKAKLEPNSPKSGSSSGQGSVSAGSAPSQSNQTASTSATSSSSSSSSTTTSLTTATTTNNSSTMSSDQSNTKQNKSSASLVATALAGASSSASQSIASSSSTSTSASNTASTSSSSTPRSHQSLLLPHATTSSAANTTPISKLTTAGGNNNIYMNINSTKLPIIRTNQLIGHPNGNENVNGTTPRLPTTAAITSHQLYQAPVNTFDVTSSALLIDRMFAHLSRESENMREWIALEKERLALERVRRQQETEREVRRERVLIDTLMRFQEQWLSFLSHMDPRIVENAKEAPPELKIPTKESSTIESVSSEQALSQNTQATNQSATYSSTANSTPSETQGK